MAQRFSIAGFILVLLLLAGCGVFDNRIGEPPDSTPTSMPFRTATPGGRISVWMVTPIGGASPGSPGEEPGIILPPAATATAIEATRRAATQTAAAPTPRPTFQTGECPLAASIPAPSIPANFNEFPAIIGVFLSNGGAPTVLESTLRSWGAINDQGGVVQADTDLTGDKIPEIIVNIYDPFTYNPDEIRNPGRLIIYGCDNFAYRSLYSSDSSPALALPVLHRVGDMNADVKAEIVFDVQSCTVSYCTRQGFILTWNPVVGNFETLNSGQIVSINGRLGVLDVEGDGILELTVTQVEPMTVTTGPTRGYIDIWDFNGLNYVLAQRVPQDTRFRIHVIQDADGELLTGRVSASLAGYRNARDNRRLLAWPFFLNEQDFLRAYATFRLVTGYASVGNDQRRNQYMENLLTENPVGSVGAGYAAMGQAFMESLLRGEPITSACLAAINVSAAYPETVNRLNRYGTANRTYQRSELCPF